MIIASVALAVRFLALPITYWLATNARVRRAKKVIRLERAQVESVRCELVVLLAEARLAGMDAAEADRAQSLIQTLNGPSFPPPARTPADALVLV